MLMLKIFLNVSLILINLENMVFLIYLLFSDFLPFIYLF